MEEMIFTRRKPCVEPKKKHFVTFEREDSYLSFRRTLEINEADLEAPKRLILELSELKSICPPQVSYELEEMKFASVSFDLKELIAIENEWKSHRKKFDFYRAYSPFNFHGTPSKQNVKSILKEGWK